MTPQAELEGHGLKFSTISCTVLREVVSRTKYCCSLEVKIFPPQKNFFRAGYATAWPANLISYCVMFEPPKSGLRFCVGATAFFRCLRRFPLCFDMLKANVNAKNCRKRVFLLQALSKMSGLY